MNYGLIGKSLAHSFSKDYFTEKFIIQNSPYTYSNYEIKEPFLLNNFLQNTNCLGFNITLPYKETIVPFLDLLTPIAQKVKAVNCIKKINNKWVGHNTDVEGFEKSFQKKLQEHHTKAIILGNGGAAKAVQCALQNLQITFKNVSRNINKGHFTYDEITNEILQEYCVIINTTPIGMYPNINEFPLLPYQLLTSKHYLFDLVYNPNPTQFLLKGKQQNTQIENGEEMLHMQADASWLWWTKE